MSIDGHFPRWGVANADAERTAEGILDLFIDGIAKRPVSLIHRHSVARARLKFEIAHRELQSGFDARIAGMTSSLRRAANSLPVHDVSITFL